MVPLGLDPSGLDPFKPSPTIRFLEDIKLDLNFLNSFCSFLILLYIFSFSVILFSTFAFALSVAFFISFLF